MYALRADLAFSMPAGSSPFFWLGAVIVSSADIPGTLRNLLVDLGYLFLFLQPGWQEGYRLRAGKVVIVDLETLSASWRAGLSPTQAPKSLTLPHMR